MSRFGAVSDVDKARSPRLAVETERLFGMIEGLTAGQAIDCIGSLMHNVESLRGHAAEKYLHTLGAIISALAIVAADEVAGGLDSSRTGEVRRQLAASIVAPMLDGDVR